VNTAYIQTRVLAGLLLACLMAAVTAAAENSGTNKPAERNTKDKPIRAALVYRPPPRGSPAVRVGGATRGPGATLPELYVLAPDHIGLTVQPQPVLQWYLSKPAIVRFEFALVRDDSIDPVLEHDFGTVHNRGFHQLNLAGTGIVLQPGIPYQWSVALIPDEQSRSHDVVATGMIERVAMPKQLAARLADADEYSQAVAYAEAGIWYDALAILSRLIAKNPTDFSLAAQRATLLKEAGLPLAGWPENPGSGH
jgi:hypothetical protein